MTMSACQVHDDAVHDIVPQDARIEHVATGFGFVEGPVWYHDHLLFSDIIRSRTVLWQMRPEGPIVQTFRTDTGEGNGLTLDHSNGLLTCEGARRRLTRCRPDGTLTVLVDHFEDKLLNSPNDVIVRSDGTIYFTDPRWHEPTRPERELSASCVFALMPNRVLTLLTDEIDQCNGLALSPDESTLYVDSSSGGYIQAFDVHADGLLGAGRRFAETPLPSSLPPHLGPPDGLKVDTQGNLYVASIGGVWIFAPDGRTLGIIMVPEAPANVAWGDTDWRTLYITARTSLYRIRLLVPGIATGVTYGYDATGWTA